MAAAAPNRPNPIAPGDDPRKYRYFSIEDKSSGGASDIDKPSEALEAAKEYEGADAANSKFL
jgi:hypothetical protein